MPNALAPSLKWTSAYLNQAVQRAEAIFGSRDSRWKIGPVLSAPDGPNIHFPDCDLTMVNVVISAGSLPNVDQIRYQIGHEAVHLLSPTKNPPAIMIEEGAAVFCSIRKNLFTRSTYVKEALDDLPANKNFEDAFNLYNEVAGIDDQAILKLRTIEPNFSAWTRDFITSNSTFPIELAERMSERRQMR